VSIGAVALAIAIGAVGPGGGGSLKPACTLGPYSSVASALTALTGASAGAVVCLSAGTYGDVDITQSKSSNTTLQSAPGAAVTVGGVGFQDGSSHIVVSDLTVTNGVTFHATGANNTIQHSDITSSGQDVYLYTGATNTTISYNKIHGCGPTSVTGSQCNEDGIQTGGITGLTVDHNSFYDVIEDPTLVIHDDAIQIFNGGSSMTFDHNYFHDNCAQNLFIKDGSYSSITVTDNLFLRNSTVPPGGCAVGGITIQIFPVTGLVMTNNTEWTASGSVLRCDGGSPTANVNHNVFSAFNNSPGDGCSYSLTETFNVFGASPFTFTPDATDVVNASPSFTNTAVDDYRLSSNPNNIGVDWKPSDFVYGPRP